MKALNITVLAVGMLLVSLAQAENWKGEMPKEPKAPDVKGGSIRTAHGFITAPAVESALQAALSVDISGTEVGGGILDVFRSLVGDQVARVRFVKHSKMDAVPFECRLTYKRDADDADAIIIDECETPSTETMVKRAKLSRSSVMTPFPSRR